MYRALITAPLLLIALAGCKERVDFPDEPGLQRFSSCGELRAYASEAMLESLVQSWYGYGWGWAAEDAAMESDGAATDSGPTDYTTTNTQEEGVDEIDLVETDGEYVYVAQDRALHIVKSWPAEDSERVATLELDGWVHGMFLKDDKVVVLQYLWDYGRSWSGTRVSVIDVADRTAPVVERTVDIEGWLADGRRIDDDVYLVVNQYLSLPQEVWDAASGVDLPEVDWSKTGDALDRELERARSEARKKLRPRVEDVVSKMDLGDLLPMWRDQVEGEAEAESEAMLACTDVYRPNQLARHSMLSIVHLDVGSGELDATGVYSDGWTVYASRDNLYVAQTSWWWWWGWGDLDMKSHLHKFELDPESEPTYVASGAVDGWLYDQFAMSEHEGFLRVATTDVDWWWGSGTTDEEEPGNNVFVLEDAGDGALEVVGSVTGIAPGERIYASRMIGERGYLVTFLQVDPLFTLDLSDPTAPRVVGELKVPGYSAYLHPMDEDHLLAVGMAGEDDGTLTGLAVSIFDVSDFANPTLLHAYEIETDNGWSWSEALWDHHAFTYHRDVLSIPVYDYGYDETTGDWTWFSGVVAFSATVDGGIAELGRVDHRDLVEESECVYSRWYGYEESVCDDWAWYANVRRSVYIEDNLYSVSDYGVKVNDLNDPDEEIARVLFWPAE